MNPREWNAMLLGELGLDVRRRGPISVREEKVERKTKKKKINIQKPSRFLKVHFESENGEIDSTAGAGDTAGAEPGGVASSSGTAGADSGEVASSSGAAGAGVNSQLPEGSDGEGEKGDGAGGEAGGEIGGGGVEVEGESGEENNTRAIFVVDEDAQSVNSHIRFNENSGSDSDDESDDESGEQDPVLKETLQEGIDSNKAGGTQYDEKSIWGEEALLSFENQKLKELSSENIQKELKAIEDDIGVRVKQSKDREEKLIRLKALKNRLRSLGFDQPSTEKAVKQVLFNAEGDRQVTVKRLILNIKGLTYNPEVNRLPFLLERAQTGKM